MKEIAVGSRRLDRADRGQARPAFPGSGEGPSHLRLSRPSELRLAGEGRTDQVHAGIWVATGAGVAAFPSPAIASAGTRSRRKASLCWGTEQGAGRLASVASWNLLPRVRVRVTSTKPGCSAVVPQAPPRAVAFVVVQRRAIFRAGGPTIAPRQAATMISAERSLSASYEARQPVDIGSPSCRSPEFEEQQHALEDRASMPTARRRRPAVRRRDR